MWKLNCELKKCIYPLQEEHCVCMCDCRTPAGQGKVNCTIKHGGVVVATEKAGSRKAAKNRAARAALRKLSSNNKQ